MAKNIKVTLTLDDSQYQRKLRSANSQLKGVGQTNTGLLASFGRLGPAIAAAFSITAIVQFSQRILEATREIENIGNQLRLVTTSSQDLDRVMTLLTQTAINNRASFAATAELFTKLKISTDELGVSEAQVVRVTTSLSQALAVAGADAATTNSVIRQFGQAMASGTVRGDEFNSLVEGLGPALAIMARETGITVGELRKMSREGELTAQVMFDMLENSKSLKEAFDSMLPTLDQLETALGDAFNRFLVKVGDATGLTDTYRTAVIMLTRELDKLAGTEGVLVNMGLDEIMQSVEDGTVSATAAIEELEARITETMAAVGRTFGGAAADMPTLNPRLTIDNEELQSLNELKDKLVEIRTEREAEAEAAKKEAEIAEQQRQAYEALIEPFQQYIDLANKFGETDYRTEQEKINDRVKEAQQVLDKLRDAYIATNGELENYADLQDKAITELFYAKLAQAEFNESLNEGAEEIRTYNSWMTGLLEDMVDFTEEQSYVRRALEEVQKSFEQGVLSLEEYNFLMDRLNGLLETFEEKAEPAKTLLQQIRENLANSKGTVEEYNALIEQLNEAFREGEIGLQEYIALKRQLDDEFMQNEAMNNFLDTLGQAQVALSQDLATAFLEGQSAAESFKNFMKKIITQVLADILRLQIIQPLLSGLFGFQFGTGGSVTGMDFGGSFFGGLFGKANGGSVSGRRPYLVGERGPELFVPGSSGSIVPNGGLGQQVTYNINAVDAASFKAMVAKDPEFLFNVTQMGARRVPS